MLHARQGALKVTSLHILCMAASVGALPSATRPINIIVAASLEAGSPLIKPTCACELVVDRGSDPQTLSTEDLNQPQLTCGWRTAVLQGLEG